MFEPGETVEASYIVRGITLAILIKIIYFFAVCWSSSPWHLLWWLFALKKNKKTVLNLQRAEFLSPKDFGVSSHHRPPIIQCLLPEFLEAHFYEEF